MQVKRNISCEHRSLSISSKIKNRLRDHPYDFTYTKTTHAKAVHYCTAFNALRVAAFQLPY